MLNVETFVSEILQSLCLQGIAEESGGDEGGFLHTIQSPTITILSIRWYYWYDTTNNGLI